MDTLSRETAQRNDAPRTRKRAAGTKPAPSKRQMKIDDYEAVSAAKPGMKRKATAKRTVAPARQTAVAKQPPKEEAVSEQQAQDEAAAASKDIVMINRAPVLTLWVKLVTERQGFDEDTALTCGKAIAGMFAQSKGRAIGIYEPKEKDPAELERRRRAEAAAGVERLPVFGTHIKAKKTDGGGYRAMESENKTVDPSKVRAYLQRAFQNNLGAAEEALKQLAEAMSPQEAAERGYEVYTQFRPSVASGSAGWGRKGELDLNHVRQLAAEM